MPKITKEEYLNYMGNGSSSSYGSGGLGDRVVLIPHFEITSGMTQDEVDKVIEMNHPVEFDFVNNARITSMVSLSTYPLVNGDIVSDHKQNEPKDYSVSGSFSLYGSKPSPFKGSNNRLTNIENYFEKMQKDGVFCDLVIRGRKDNTNKFKLRSNMILSSITWTENQSQLAFDFSFKEVMTVKVDIDTIQPTQEDENQPIVTDASTLDFTDTFLDWNEIDKLVVAELYDIGIVSQEFLNQYFEYLTSVATGGLVGAGIGLGVSVSFVLGLAALFGGIASIPVAGWVAAGVIVIGGLIIGMIWAAFNSLKKIFTRWQYKVATFQAYQDKRKAEQENNRFTNYLSSIHQQLEVLEKAFSAMSPGVNQNQQCIATLDGNIYYFNFTKNNTSSDGRTIWSMKMQDVNENTLVNIEDIEGAAFTSISDLTSSNGFYRTQAGNTLYLVNKKYNELLQQNKQITDEERKSINSDLTNYAVLLAKTDMDKFNENLKNIIENAMKA